ncbi:damage-control phosphatase ARMT1 family protein [Mycolicibacterium sp. CBMA 226]|uniref:damage-control phosphatase ARMT1 family protein n=1 Tax=Mycolicibacterium sp. CBMA 226 TaxID=2606611 RepID=UPI00130C28CA|nr:damage-control phosphatase ARMT1 family protein [Mycolicibacterium sp. CBMA 226]MUL79477.1 protein-glutamate O-methyltransferase family protein [Mycolicibacterium sp. CBMA 226]
MDTSAAPTITAAVPGSFEWDVFHERHPKLIRQVLDSSPYGSAEQAMLQQLLVESTTGVIELLPAEAHDRDDWLVWGEHLYGRPWGDVPFLWSESYFYRRLLEAVGYFGTGAWCGVDPFAPVKNAELTGPEVDQELRAFADLADGPEAQQHQALLVAALWGNRADLSFQLQLNTAPADARSAGILVDDSALLWSALGSQDNPIVCVVADNAGRELLADLVLADALLTQGLAAETTLYVKPHPYYVSDATMADVLAVIRRLRTESRPQIGRIGDRLWEAVRSGRLKVRTHKFFCAPLAFHDMPDDLAAEFATATMTVMKGDLNYRRLVGDRYWPATTPFNQTVDYFPSPVTALRTLKSEVAVGLTSEQLAELDAGGQGWRTSGGYALIQVHVD